MKKYIIVLFLSFNNYVDFIHSNIVIYVVHFSNDFDEQRHLLLAGRDYPIAPTSYSFMDGINVIYGCGLNSNKTVLVTNCTHN